MVSIPSKTPITVSELKDMFWRDYRCRITQVVGYDTVAQNYYALSSASKLEAGSGYWMHNAGGACSTSYADVTNNFVVHVKQGLNVIGIGTREVKTSDLTAECKKQGANVQVWSWDAKTKTNKSASKLEPGKAYWINSSGNCEFDFGKCKKDSDCSEDEKCQEGSCAVKYRTFVYPKTNNPGFDFELWLQRESGKPIEEKAYAFVYSGKKRIKTVELFNDGGHWDATHNDWAAGNRFTIDKKGSYTLRFCAGSSEASCRFVDGPVDLQVKDLSCEELFPGHNDADGDRINIVLIGEGYSDMDEFKNLARRVLSWDGEPRVKGIQSWKKLDWGLFSIEPFKSNKDKFNIWYLSDLVESDVLGYYTGYLPYCGLENVYPVYIVNKNFRSGSSLPNFMGEKEIDKDKIKFGISRNSYDSDSDEYVVLVHEACHALFGLNDEGPGDGKKTYYSYPNCAHSEAEARKWWSGLLGQIDPFYYEYKEKASSLVGGLRPFDEKDIKIQYFAGGCNSRYGDASVYKPTKESIMSDPFTYPVLGSVNRERVEQVLNLFSGS